MILISYSDLFNTDSIYEEYKKSEHYVFSEYIQKCCGLKINYSVTKEPEIPKIIGFSVEDEKKWMLTKLKHGLSF